VIRMCLGETSAVRSASDQPDFGAHAKLSVLLRRTYIGPGAHYCVISTPCRYSYKYRGALPLDPASSVTPPERSLYDLATANDNS
jgi:hypothetical protein